jgi:hypothetical protein
MLNVQQRRAMQTGFWWGNLKERELIGRPWHRWEESVKMNVRETGWVKWTGLVWLRTETSNTLL